MSRARFIRASHILIALTFSISLVYIYARAAHQNLELGLRSHSQFPSELSRTQKLNEPQYHLATTVQLEPEPQIGSEIDPDHCSPSLLPFEIPAERSNDVVPNIVHYVWLSAHDGFSLDFNFFISVYSASLYFRPEKIYIHTDASPELWEAAKTTGNDATRWTLNIPEVIHHWIKPPKYTLNCLEIKRIEHVSDFVRTQQLFKHGGIYLDADAVPLRDVRELRESGFSNIVGNEDTERVNNGVIISKPRNALLSIFMREQHIVFDNEWLTHSVELLTTISHRLHVIPGEVMILGVKAFAPSSWVVNDVEALFNPHNDTGSSTLVTGTDEPLRSPNSFQDVLKYWQGRDSTGKADWEKDYSSSYVLHAFKGISDPYWPKNINLEYVLARQSNFAKAVYPAIKHAIDVGIIDKTLQ